MAVISLFDLKIYQKISSNNLASSTETELREMLKSKQGQSSADDTQE